jgi:ABC-2 type transport system ATP-binding protein
MLDEPVNGLDPEGIQWIRGLLQGLADEGRTVFVSSHLMSEMALVAEHFVVVGRGRLIADVSSEALAAMAEHQAVRVRTPQPGRLRDVLVAGGGNVHAGEDGSLTVSGLSAERTGEIAAASGVVLHELTPQHTSLEDIFMDLTRDAVDYHGIPTREAA